MASNVAEPAVQTIHIVKERAIFASLSVTFEALLEELGPGGEMLDGKPFPMVIEAWPGGRWYRDLGGNAGHFWGHVQVIKPPALLELCGPMFMSFPGINHLQYRLTADGDRTLLKLTHRALGEIPQEMAENVGGGWEYKLKRVGDIAERLAGKRRA